jgi:MEMO1 family protein
MIMNPVLDRPRLRPGLSAEPDSDPRFLLLWDRLRLSDRVLRISRFELAILQLFDGSRTLLDVQVESIRLLNGEIVPLEFFGQVAARMEEVLFLDGPRFQERLYSPLREPACIGCYPAAPDEIRTTFHGLFTHPHGPGLPREPGDDPAFVGALLPHIDYARGGVSYAWGFKEVFERTRASLFVIVGTSHYSPQRFTLTRKHFRTPLGTVPTDQDYIDRLVSRYGDGLFDDPYAHLPEHSIELEVVFLQYLYEQRRQIRIVPLLVGSFHDCVAEGRAPGKAEDVARMAEALREIERELREPVCYLISGDLAHIGPKFGDEGPLSATFLLHSKDQDQQLLRAAEGASLEGYFEVIAEEHDRRRICGFPPTATILEAVKPDRGSTLHYAQYVDPRGHESVSFASMAFYRDGRSL